MNRKLQNLAEVAVRLQQESIRFRSIMESIPAKRRCSNSTDDIIYYIDTASGTISDIIVELTCAGQE